MIASLLDRTKPHVVCVEDAFATEESAREFEEQYAQGHEPEKPFYRALFETMREKQVPRMYVLERFPPNNDPFAALQGFGVTDSCEPAEKEFWKGNWENTLYLTKQKTRAFRRGMNAALLKPYTSPI